MTARGAGDDFEEGTWKLPGAAVEGKSRAPSAQHRTEVLRVPKLYFKAVFGVSRGSTVHTAVEEASECLHGRVLLVSVCAPVQILTKHRLSQALLAEILATSFGDGPDE